MAKSEYCALRVMVVGLAQVLVDNSDPERYCKQKVPSLSSVPFFDAVVERRNAPGLLISTEVQNWPLSSNDTHLKLCKTALM
ncbi:hypothetical protein [uncultured Kiloniella sp.]|uniref:hypothetical protein n=1 Tax=uncultured Kiloniella sp. TaxID=1133091 RepID=UPI002626AFF0|nr:hypothetical protein [uncultured Kiloniella sp.]